MNSLHSVLYKFGVIVAFEDFFVCFEFGILYLKDLWVEGLIFGNKTKGFVFEEQALRPTQKKDTYFIASNLIIFDRN